MKSKQKDFFANKAEDYDKESSRTRNVKNIADSIIIEIEYHKNMSILDFGSGTGLLLSEIAPFVDKITAVDISKSMNEILRNKKDSIDCNLEIIEMDLSKENLDMKFDGIISSMTIHHVNDTRKLFEKFYNLLKNDGTIAISDLDKEDGHFHSEDTGVFHFGFNREEFLSIAKDAGFKDLKIQTASNIEKPHGNYPVFLLTGKK